MGIVSRRLLASRRNRDGYEEAVANAANQIVETDGGDGVLRYATCAVYKGE